MRSSAEESVRHSFCLLLDDHLAVPQPHVCGVAGLQLALQHFLGHSILHHVLDGTAQGFPFSVNMRENSVKETLQIQQYSILLENNLIQ